MLLLSRLSVSFYYQNSSLLWPMLLFQTLVPLQPPNILHLLLLQTYFGSVCWFSNSLQLLWMSYSWRNFSNSFNKCDWSTPAGLQLFYFHVIHHYFLWPSTDLDWKNKPSTGPFYFIHCLMCCQYAFGCRCFFVFASSTTVKGNILKAVEFIHKSCPATASIDLASSLFNSYSIIFIRLSVKDSLVCAWHAWT